MMVGIIDHLRGFEHLLRHDGAVPERIVIDEPLSDVAVRLLDGDVEHLSAAAFHCHDFIGGGFGFEPAPLLDVLPKFLLLARQAKADPFLKGLRREPLRVNVPAPISVRSARRSDAEIEQDHLDLLAHCRAGSREDDAVRPGVPVAVVQRPKERRDNGLWRFQNAIGHILHPGREPGLQPERAEEILDGSG